MTASGSKAFDRGRRETRNRSRRRRKARSALPVSSCQTLRRSRKRPDRRQRLHPQLVVPLAAHKIVDDGDRMPFFRQIQRRGPAAVSVTPEHSNPHYLPPFNSYLLSRTRSAILPQPPIRHRSPLPGERVPCEGERSADPAPAGSACRANTGCSFRRTGEGSLHCRPRPTQKAENSGNELSDLVQVEDLGRDVYTKRTGSGAQNAGWLRQRCSCLRLRGLKLGEGVP